MKIKLVVATRDSQASFFSRTATGRSLSRHWPRDVQLHLFAGNSRGLPSLYNQVIADSRGESCILAFAHDDVHLIDLFWPERMLAAVERYHIAGLAGSIGRRPGQPSWFEPARDGLFEGLSGTVAHGSGFPDCAISVYGPSNQRVKLLDGLLLWGKSDTFNDHGLAFEESQDFHFYDLDLCRQAEVKGLSCGTWPISVVHESGGQFGTPDWKRAYDRYIAKWGG